MNQRSPAIDALRSASVLYIVGFWHLLNYTQAFPMYYNPISIRTTVIVLGLFVFLSGVLLGKSSIEFNARDIIGFYRKRVVRIYPLYLCALTLFMVYGLCDRSTWLKAAVLVSMFYGPPPLTLWFITMIMVFYLVAPLLIALRHDTRKYWITAGATFSALLTFCVVSTTADPRIALYFPAFALGISTANGNFRLGLLPLGISLALALALSALSSAAPEVSFFSIPMAALAPLAVFSLCMSYPGRLGTGKVVAHLSYAGFAMYLFHRPIYTTLKHIYFPANPWAQVLYLTAVCLPLVFGASWLVQKAYDSLLEVNRFRRSA